MTINTGNTRYNNSIVSQITYKLDMMDKVHDNHISKNIWDAFWARNDAKSNYKGKKEAKVDNKGISVSEAKKLIMTRLFNAFNKLGKSKNLDKIGAEWLKNMPESGQQTKNTAKQRTKSDVVTPKTKTTPADSSASRVQTKQQTQTSNQTKTAAQTKPQPKTEQNKGASAGSKTKAVTTTVTPTVQPEAVTTTNPVTTGVTENTLVADNNSSAKSNSKYKNEAEVEALIRTELNRRNLGGKNIHMEFWKEKIAKYSSQYNIPEEILIGIIARETKFSKKQDSHKGHGAMQITRSIPEDILPNLNPDRYKKYKQLDPKLLNDVIYTKDKNGKLVLRYTTWSDMVKACGRDDELSIKAGTLAFKMKYAEAVSSVTKESLDKVINKIATGTLKITEEQNKRAVALALRNYNGNPKRLKGHKRPLRDEYRDDVMASLRKQNFDFSKTLFVKS